jgi:hypothetical protein
MQSHGYGSRQFNALVVGTHGATDLIEMLADRRRCPIRQSCKARMGSSADFSSWAATEEPMFRSSPDQNLEIGRLLDLTRDASLLQNGQGAVS